MDLGLSTTQSLLCSVLSDDQSEARAIATCRLWQELSDERVLVLARTNRITPIVAHALMDALSANDVPVHWRQAHQETSNRIVAYLAELDRIAARLAREGIPLVALKNGGIARGIHPCPGCCPMGDLDVLVTKRDFRTAHHILLDEDYRFEFRNPLEEAKLEVAERNGGAEYWKILPSGEKLWLELQWRPVAGRWIRPDQEPSAEELMSRSTSIVGTDVRLLAPEDNLLQVALHTAKHSYVRAPGFRLQLDVERIVRAYPNLNWDVFMRRVAALQVRTPVYFSLAIPKALFEAPIPDEVLAQLKPPAWKERLISRWLQHVGLFNPDEQKFNRVSYVLFNALLYDDLAGLWCGIFPERAWMRERYGFRSYWLLPYYHGRRLVDLIFRRAST